MVEKIKFLFGLYKESKRVTMNYDIMCLKVEDIKFRGVDKKTKKFVFGSLLYLGEKTFIIDNNSVIGFDGECLSAVLFKEVIPETVSQNSLQFDKYKKEIYPYDIIKYKSFDGKYYTQIVPNILAFHWWDDNGQIEDIEIIGNKFNNK